MPLAKLIRHRLTAPHPFGARRFAPVQTALQLLQVRYSRTFTLRAELAPQLWLKCSAFVSAVLGASPLPALKARTYLRGKRVSATTDAPVKTAAISRQARLRFSDKSFSGLNILKRNHRLVKLLTNLLKVNVAGLVESLAGSRGLFFTQVQVRQMK